MKHILSILGICTALMSHASATAADQVKKIPASLDANRAYLLVRVGERSPDLWNTISVMRYDEKLEDIRGLGRAKTNPVAKGEDKSIFIGPKAHLLELDHVRTYLVAVTPGRYVLTGGPTTCNCLGSFQFDASAGQMTDLGTIYIGPENGSSPWKDLSGLRSSPDIEERGYTVADAMIIHPATSASSLPEGMQTLPRLIANYLPASRFGNHSGQLLNKSLPLGEPK